MELGSIRPVFTGTIAPAPKASVANEAAVRTELKGPAAVVDPKKSAKVDDKAQKSGEDSANRLAQAAQATEVEPARRELERRFEIDPSTQALVFKKVDMASGDVVEQVPEEALLRMRASIAAWGETQAERERPVAYDMEA